MYGIYVPNAKYIKQNPQCMRVILFYIIHLRGI